MRWLYLPWLVGTVGGDWRLPGGNAEGLEVLEVLLKGGRGGKSGCLVGRGVQ